MNNTTKGIIAVLVVGALVFATMKLTTKKSKRKMAEFIVDSGNHGNVDTLVSFGDDYIEAWFKAAKKGVETFTLNGVSYNTKGGKLS
jgi:hypothetical protein